MNEAVEVKIEEKQASKKRIRQTRNGKAMPLKHTAEINPFFKGVFRRYHVKNNPQFKTDFLGLCCEDCKGEYKQCINNVNRTIGILMTSDLIATGGCMLMCLATNLEDPPGFEICASGCAALGSKLMELILETTIIETGICELNYHNCKDRNKCCK